MYDKIFKKIHFMVINFNKKFSEKTGSMLVEGAIFLPIFIAALATLVCLIKICLFQIIVFSAYADQAKIASVQGRMALMIHGPNDIFGTKVPSITSR